MKRIPLSLRSEQLWLQAHREGPAKGVPFAPLSPQALHGISALEATLATAPDTNAAGAETALDNPVCTWCS